MANNDDNELLARYLGGDPSAMEALVERYRNRLFGFIYRMVTSHADADDIFQEVWMKVIRKADVYRADNFAAWLMTLTRNIVIDRIRIHKPMASLDEESDSGGSILDQVPARSPSPHENSAARELGDRLAMAVAGLPPEQREVFLMRTQMDLGFKAIAGIQGVSINTALARMQYAVDKLRKALKGDYDLLGRAMS